MICDPAIKISTPSFLEDLAGHKLRVFKKRRLGKTADLAEGRRKYKRPTVYINGKQRLVSRVVMEHIIGRPLLESEIVHHKDENPFNNDPANLLVVSRSDHKKIHSDIGVKTRLKKVWNLDLQVVSEMFRTKTCAEIAKHFGCSSRTVSRLLKSNKVITMKKGPKITKPRQVRQGDLLITETNEQPTGDKLTGKIILAHGEVTGHHHAVECDKADWWKGDGEQFVTIKAPANVTHQEHGLIPLRKRTHKVRRQSEYSPEEIRRVAD